MRGLILAVQFLTRLPTPQLADFRQQELSGSAVWFPVVGMLIGLLLFFAAWLGQHAGPWLAGLLMMLVWVGVTGALHLDGAADLADALGASHRDSERFFSVLKDPHIGSFGVVVLVALMLTKLVTLAWLVQADAGLFWPLLLIPAWARLGSIYWSESLKPLVAGSGERFAWQIPVYSIPLWGGLLFLLSWIVVSFPFALLAVVILWLWRSYLHWRLAGMNGDCLGAGVEYSECVMLLALCLL